MTRSGGVTMKPEQQTAARGRRLPLRVHDADRAFGTPFFMVFPDPGAAVGLANMMPLGLYEVGLGIWLLVRGIRTPVVA